MSTIAQAFRNFFRLFAGSDQQPQVLKVRRQTFAYADSEPVLLAREEQEKKLTAKRAARAAQEAAARAAAAKKQAEDDDSQETKIMLILR